MRRDIGQTSLVCRILYDVPDGLYRKPLSPDASNPVNLPEDLPFTYACSRDPIFKLFANPVRYWDCPDMAALTDQIDYGPVTLSLFEVAQSQRSRFATSQPASQQQRQQRSVTFAFGVRGIRNLPERLRLIRGQPVAKRTPSFRKPGRDESRLQDRH